MSDWIDSDAVAGVADLFGAVTRPELERALSELAYRRDEECPEGCIETAIETFALVTVDDDEALLVPGPAAFPTLVDGAEDLPHILDLDPRSVDRTRVGRAAAERFRAEATSAIERNDAERARELLDVSYEIEAWGGPELSEIRAQLDGMN